MNDMQRAGRAFPFAVLSFILGIASLFLLIIAGLPAMFLGLQSLRAINAAGARRGRLLAIVGMGLGALTTLVTIVGVVIYGLLLLRVSNNKQTCASNLGRIGNGILQYQLDYEHYPQGTAATTSSLPPEKRLSWMALILPYVEPPKASSASGQSEQKFDLSLAWDNPKNAAESERMVPGYLCPAYPHYQGDRKPAPTDYVGLGGIGIDSPELPLRNAGKELNPAVGFFGYDRELTPDDLVRGTTRTAVVGETEIENGPWAAGGKSTVRGLDPSASPYIGYERQFGGMHPGGGFFLFVDDHVEFLSDNTDPKMLEELIKLAPN